MLDTKLCVGETVMVASFIHPRQLIIPPDSDVMRSATILIIDDHRQVRESFAFFLGNCAGVEVVGEASNGIEGVIQYQRLRPDVVLMDLVMPIMDGVEATRMIREHDPAATVIALTGFDDQSLENAALDAGARMCLSKATDLVHLLDIIRSAARIDPSSADPI